jgi:hypothetical protein
VPALLAFDFAAIRVVPRVDREEFVNAGVIVFCLAEKYLEARIHVDEARLRAICPELDVAMVREHLLAFPRVCGGGSEAGPIGEMSLRERFHWLVAPRSTMIQISPVHSGLCESPETAIRDLFRQVVLL